VQLYICTGIDRLSCSMLTIFQCVACQVRIRQLP
jgi:hypothetical protein